MRRHFNERRTVRTRLAFAIFRCTGVTFRTLTRLHHRQILGHFHRVNGLGLHQIGLPADTANHSRQSFVTPAVDGRHHFKPCAVGDVGRMQVANVRVLHCIVQHRRIVRRRCATLQIGLTGALHRSFHFYRPSIVTRDIGLPVNVNSTRVVRVSGHSYTGPHTH